MPARPETDPLLPAQTRETLDRLRCQCGKPACAGELYLKQKCHPDAGTVVIYTAKDGIARIRCKQCHNLVVGLLVAKDLIV